jgi:signal transduction histidine kinase/CheY-like chemotaxis protein
MKKSLLVIAVGAALLFVAIDVAVLTYRHEARQIESSTISDLSTVRDLKVDFVAQWRASLLADAELLRHTPAFVNLALVPSQHHRGDVEDVLNWVAPNFSARAYTSVRLIAPGQELDEPPEVRSLIVASRTGDITASRLSSPFRDASGHVRFAAVGPITTSDGTVTGYAVALVADPSVSLFPTLQRWPTQSPSAETLLVAREGDDIVYLNELRHVRGSTLTMRRPMTATLPAALAFTSQSTEGRAGLFDYRNLPVLAAWSRVPDSDWAVVSKIDSAEVYQPLHWFMWSLTMTLTALAGTGIFITLWVSARRDAEMLRKTTRAEDRLSLAVRSAGIGLWDWDVERDVAFFSPEYEAQVGCAPGELATSFADWAARLHPDDRDRTLAALQEYTATADPSDHYVVEFRLRHKNGSYRNILSRAQGEFVDGRLVRMIGCTIDLTSTKMLEAQLRQAQKMEAVGRLAGGIAHDFNNLLTIINGYVEFLLEDHPSGAFARDLQEIQRAGKSAVRLSRQLLVFSRTTRQKSAHTNVNQLITDWQRLLGRTLGDDVRVQIDLCGDETVVNLDDEQIEQVIMNLAVNARDAMPAGGTLALRTDVRRVHEREAACTSELKPGNYVIVSVQDTGTGIPADVRPHIFEPFFTTKESGKGTGLGLATVHGVMTGCGGAVGIKTSPSGTTFSLYFPQVIGAASASLAASSSRSQTPFPRCVLVVDDDAAVRQVVAREIANAGHRVEIGDIDYAFAALKEGRHFDILVTDVIMPQISGIELSERMGAKLPELRTIFITGYADSDITAAFPSNAVVLRKPLARSALRSALDTTALQTIRSRGFAHAV